MPGLLSLGRLLLLAEVFEIASDCLNSHFIGCGVLNAVL